MFADPEGWEANILAQARGEGLPPAPHGYGTNPVAKPDMFADPEGYRWLVGEIGRRANIDQFHEDRVNSSMGHWHKRLGDEFETAYTNVSRGLDASNPAHRNLVQNILNSGDPGAALMQAHEFVKTANESAQRFGGPPFAPGLVRQRAPLCNNEGLPPRSRDEAQELDVFDSVFRDGTADIWSDF
jgi:hypothetical protein